ncbi:hypothetical protein SLA2020_449160 [Shorea laevis]
MPRGLQRALEKKIKLQLKGPVLERILSYFMDWRSKTKSITKNPNASVQCLLENSLTVTYQRTPLMPISSPTNSRNLAIFLLDQVHLFEDEL